MKLAFHIGVHGTDGDRLLKTLKENNDELLRQGTEIVPPERHSEFLDQTLMQLQGGTATNEIEALLLDSLLVTEDPQRAIFSSTSFLGAVGRIVGQPGFYWQLGTRAASLVNLFPNHDVEIFAAIRNPATLLADMLPQFWGGDYAKFMQGHPPEALRWREPARQLVQAVQGRRVVLWCHEDAPLIWPEITRLIGDVDPDIPMKATMLYMQELLDAQAFQNLRETLGAQDRLSVAARREICARFLQDHAKADALEQEIDMPGWTQDLVDRMTENYYQDVAEITVMPGVEFIMP
ncbi:hypothetical protein Q0601_04870 [Paracoccus onubensis]|uniref:hypothetical protein n=1 Tax=Paracoccus onubensis TaxID=1675788 RepID=UPI00272F2AB4|nr:hypothetical protein [Paracoccus onubensis]MDP0926498.1 hypothetical protein [Paracoccus onubensis]